MSTATWRPERGRELILGLLRSWRRGIGRRPFFTTKVTKGAKVDPKQDGRLSLPREFLLAPGRLRDRSRGKEFAERVRRSDA